MISIFNGRSRTLGREEREDVHLQVSVQIRDHLHLFKGAKLSVLMAISLHTDEKGWAYPSIPTLRKETGYDATTISKALTDLCKVEIDGHRVLLAVQKKSTGKFDNNHYLIFPSPAEVAQYEQATEVRKPRRVKTAPKTSETEEAPYMGFPYTEKPYTEKPYTEKSIQRRTSNKPEPDLSGGGSAPLEPTRKRDAAAAVDQVLVDRLMTEQMLMRDQATRAAALECVTAEVVDRLQAWRLDIIERNRHLPFQKQKKPQAILWSCLKQGVLPDDLPAAAVKRKTYTMAQANELLKTNPGRFQEIMGNIV